MNQKKDQKNKSWIAISAIVIALLIIFTIVIFDSKNKDKNSSKSSNSSISKIQKSDSKTSSSKVKTTIQNGKLLKKEPTLDQFNKIKIADTSSIKQGDGLTLSEAKKLFGQPTNLSSNKNNDVSSDFANWTYNRTSTTDSISLSISFTNKIAVSKALIGIQVKRPKKIDLTTFNNIKISDSYENVIKVLGQPNGITESISQKKVSKTAIYSSDLNTASEDKNKANVTFVFNGGKLISKNQTGLK